MLVKLVFSCEKRAVVVGSSFFMGIFYKDFINRLQILKFAPRFNGVRLFTADCKLKTNRYVQ